MSGGRLVSRLLGQGQVSSRNVLPVPLSQAIQYYVDGQQTSGGDDRNTGASGAPVQRVRTLLEKLARGDFFFPARVTGVGLVINIMSDCAADDTAPVCMLVDGTYTFASAPYVRFVGTRKQATTGTLGTVTAKDVSYGVATLWSVATGLSDTTSYGNKAAGSGYYIRITSGARSGAFARIHTGASGGVTLTSEWLTSAGSAAVTPVSGDPFEIVSMPSFPGATTVAAMASMNFEDLAFPGNTSHQLALMGMRKGSSGFASGVRFLRCDIGATIQAQNCPVDLFGCGANNVTLDGGAGTIIGGQVTGSLILLAGRCVIKLDTLREGALADLRVYKPAEAVIGGMACRNVTAATGAIVVWGGKLTLGKGTSFDVDPTSPLWGSGNTLGINLQEPGSLCTYSSGKLPTMAATTELSVGNSSPTTKVWSGTPTVPYLDANLLAGMIAR